MIDNPTKNWDAFDYLSFFEAMEDMYAKMNMPFRAHDFTGFKIELQYAIALAMP